MSKSYTFFNMFSVHSHRDDFWLDLGDAAAFGQYHACTSLSIYGYLWVFPEDNEAERTLMSVEVTG